MDAKTDRAIVAFAVAPLTPMLHFWALESSRNSDPFQNLAMLPAILYYAFLTTYPLALAVGVPAYLLITKHSTLRFWHVLAFSGLAGIAAVAIVGEDAYQGAALGLSSGFTFWLIWYRKPSGTAPP